MPDRIGALALLCIAVAMANTTPAGASGGISCEAHDSAIQLEVLADVARAVGSKVFSPQGEIKIKDKHAQWTAVPLNDGLTQSWIEGRDARLQFYVEKTALNGAASAELVIRTSRNADHGTFRGSYVLRVYGQGADGKVITLQGQAACTLD